MKMYALRNIKTGQLLSCVETLNLIDGTDFESAQVYSTFTLKIPLYPTNVSEIWLVNHQNVATDVLKNGKTQLGMFEDGSINEPIFAHDINLADIEVVEVELTIKES